MTLLEDLSLIILNYNSSEDTITCVHQLLSFNVQFRVIVVDNQSTDQSFQLLEKEFADLPLVDVIATNKNGGYSYGNNYGVRFALENYSPKVIGILNPDVIIPDLSVFTEMLTKLTKNENYAMIGGATITAGIHSPNQSAWNIPNTIDVVWERSLLNRREKNNQFKMIETTLAQVDCIVGCFFLIKADVFQEIGLFDENVFLYNEENILGIKLKKKGYQALVSTNSFYYHNHDHQKDKAANLAKKMRFLKIRYTSRAYLIKTYYSPILIIPLFLVEAMNAIQISLGHVKRLVRQQLKLKQR